MDNTSHKSIASATEAACGDVQYHAPQGRGGAALLPDLGHPPTSPFIH